VAWVRGPSPQIFAYPYRETYCSRSWIVRNFLILIVSAVKICKHCLQTASASGWLRPPDALAGFRPLTPLGDFRSQAPWAMPPLVLKGQSGAFQVGACVSVVCLDSRLYVRSVNYAGARTFLVWIACVAFIILMLDNFLLWQPNNSRKSASTSMSVYSWFCLL